MHHRLRRRALVAAALAGLAAGAARAQDAPISLGQAVVRSSRACSTARWRSGRSTTRPTSSGGRPSPTGSTPSAGSRSVRCRRDEAGAPPAARGAMGGARACGDGLYADPFLALEPGRHTAVIKRLDADREGRFLVTASDDKTVRVWAAGDGRCCAPCACRPAPATSARPSPPQSRPTAPWSPPAGGRRRPERRKASTCSSGRAGGCCAGSAGCRTASSISPSRPTGPGSPRRSAGRQGCAPDRPRGGPGGGGGRGLRRRSYGGGVRRRGPARDHGLDGKVRLYGPGLRLLRAAEVPGGKRPYGIAFSSDGGLAVGYEDATAVDVLDAGTLGRLLAADTNGVRRRQLSSVAWSAGGGSLYAGGAGSGGDSACAGGRTAGGYAPRHGRGQDTVMALRGLPDGRLAFAATEPRLGLLGADGAGLERGAGHRRLPRPVGGLRGLGGRDAGRLRVRVRRRGAGLVLGGRSAG